jgi:thiol-disulfide isomerase/thioredoxin
MKFSKHMLLALLPFALSAAVVRAEVKDGSRADYDALINDKKNAIVMVTMDGCGHCKHSSPELDAASNDPELSDIEFLKVKSDDAEMAQILDENRFNGFPAYIIIKKGELRDARMGAQTKDELKNLAHQYIRNDSMAQNVDATAPVQSSQQEAEGFFAKLMGMLMSIVSAIKNMIVGIFDWIKGLFSR